jgi:hypothetical protein
VVKLVKTILEVEKEDTATAKKNSRVIFFAGCPPNTVLQGAFEGDGCG